MTNYVKVKRAKKSRGPGDPHYLTPHWKALRRYVLMRDNCICWKCGKHANTVDHLIPRSRGGSDDPLNLAACCGKCNSAKKATYHGPSAITINW